ncbi:hypothetical protein [Corallococcus sp. M7]
MSKTKKRLKMSRKYRVAYMAPEGAPQEACRLLDALPQEAPLAAIITNCRELKVEAVLSAEDGEAQGWVNADGTYRLD